jgi:transposase-like protein
MAKHKRPQPQWQPIRMLPTLARHIDGMLEADREQYETLLEAKLKPYVLDNATVTRVIRAFETQAKDFWLFEEQLKRWQSGPLTAAQRQEVERLVGQMRALRENNEKVLKLSRELAQGTIEKVLAKSDAELGLEFLLHQLPRQ